MCFGCNSGKGNLVFTWFQKIFPFFTIRDANKFKNDMMSTMSSRGAILKKEIQGTVDTRFANIKPRVIEYVQEGIKTATSNADLVLIGVKNAIKGYGDRSTERDERLLKIIHLLCKKVEELEKRLDGDNELDNK